MHPGLKRMWYGLAIAALGLAISAGSYLSVSGQGGGHYYVAIGAIAVGGVRFVTGLIQWLASPRQVLPPSPPSSVRATAVSRPATSPAATPMTFAPVGPPPEPASDRGLRDELALRRMAYVAMADGVIDEFETKVFSHMRERLAGTAPPSQAAAEAIGALSRLGIPQSPHPQQEWPWLSASDRDFVCQSSLLMVPPGSGEDSPQLKRAGEFASACGVDSKRFNAFRAAIEAPPADAPPATVLKDLSIRLKP